MISFINFIISLLSYTLISKIFRSSIVISYGVEDLYWSKRRSKERGAHLLNTSLQQIWKKRCLKENLVSFTKVLHYSGAAYFSIFLKLKKYFLWQIKWHGHARLNKANFALQSTWGNNQQSEGRSEMDKNEYSPPPSPHLLLTPQLTNLRHWSWKKNSSPNIDSSLNDSAMVLLWLFENNTIS